MKIEYIVNKLISRKFFAFIVACIFLWIGKLDTQTWKWIAVAYMFGESVIDSVRIAGNKFKSKK